MSDQEIEKLHEAFFTLLMLFRGLGFTEMLSYIFYKQNCEMCDTQFVMCDVLLKVSWTPNKNKFIHDILKHIPLSSF